ncbi:uncharacterized protein LOC115990808 [Quercus lobata]|uniref:uncharacterized protein LOC115990808 n=1 Tax=Quercus lobata TaxID=97700 RepID=UPI001244F7E6|nr:uncharacterized protein LOC115990808 [Quercus lobata]
MRKGEDIFRKGVSWVAGRDSELSFWYDKWCSVRPIRSLVQGPLSVEEEKLGVKDVVSANGWNWSRISIPIQESISNILIATPVSLAAKGQDRLAYGSGGLIRNGEDEWVCGYARKIGTTTSFAVELWCLRDEILQCLNLQLPAIEIEIDAKSIVELLNNPRAAERVVSTLVDDCRYLISQLPRVRVKHCVREANRCADVLARLGSKQENDFLVFRSPPVDVWDLLKADANGLYVNRFCSELILAG